MLRSQKTRVSLKVALTQAHFNKNSYSELLITELETCKSCPHNNKIG